MLQCWTAKVIPTECLHEPPGLKNEFLENGTVEEDVGFDVWDFFAADSYARLAQSVLPVVLHGTTADRSLPYDMAAFEQTVRGNSVHQAFANCRPTQAPAALREGSSCNG